MDNDTKANKQNVTTRIFMVVGNGFGHSKINLLHWPDNSVFIDYFPMCACSNRNVNEFRSMLRSG